MANKTFEDIKKEQLEKELNRDDNNRNDYNDYTARRSSRRKKTPLQRFTGAVIPAGSDSVGEAVRKIVLLFSIVVTIVCSILIIRDMNVATKQVVADQDRIDLKQEVEISGIIPLENDKIERIKKEAPNILDKYVALYDQNPDIIGWVKIEDTPIDYPVMQFTDNDFYLYRDFDKKDSKLGSIFADYHVKFKPTVRPHNTVLYGHNISNGTYFAKLTNYYPKKYGSLDFYLTHPTVTFDTIYAEGTYKVFAGVFINTEEKHGDVYEYYRKRTFKDKTAFYDFTQNVMDRSVFYTDVDLEYGDEFLTLSTCYYPLGNDVDTRFVVFARRVREGESAEVDVSKAYINPSPLYFDYYYRVNGGSWKGREWDTSLVGGLDDFLLQSIPASEQLAITNEN